jgi:hypothetical protein
MSNLRESAHLPDGLPRYGPFQGLYLIVNSSKRRVFIAGITETVYSLPVYSDGLLNAGYAPTGSDQNPFTL